MGNVVLINEFATEVEEQIQRFLRSKSRGSKNTSIAYEQDIKQFFEITRQKKIEHLSKRDLKYTIGEFEDYQSYLLDELGLSASTVNRKIASINGCMRYLYRNGTVEDVNFLEIERVPNKYDSYDLLTEKEVEKILEYVGTTGRKRTALIKKALIEFACDTCLRREECLSLTWNDFVKFDEDHAYFRVRAKGNKTVRKRISLDRYKKLLTIKSDKTNKVFDISNSTIDRMMEDIRKFLEIDSQKRKIVFHSFRKTGGHHIFKETRDVNQARKALGHSSIATTDRYINKEEDYGVMGMFSSRDGIDQNLYKKVDYKLLIKAIENLNKDEQLSINRKIQELKNN